MVVFVGVASALPGPTPKAHKNFITSKIYINRSNTIRQQDSFENSFIFMDK